MKVPGICERQGKTFLEGKKTLPQATRKPPGSQRNHFSSRSFQRRLNHLAESARWDPKIFLMQSTPKVGHFLLCRILLKLRHEILAWPCHCISRILCSYLSDYFNKRHHMCAFCSMPESYHGLLQDFLAILLALFLSAYYMLLSFVASCK